MSNGFWVPTPSLVWLHQRAGDRIWLQDLLSVLTSTLFLKIMELLFVFVF